jgi:hypothetical protein
MLGYIALRERSKIALIEFERDWCSRFMDLLLDTLSLQLRPNLLANLIEPPIATRFETIDRVSCFVGNHR